MQSSDLGMDQDKCVVDASDIHHEINGADTKERQAEIDAMDKTKRVFTLAKKGTLRKASDGTIYDTKPGGQLIRLTPRETKAEKKARKKANKLKGK